LFEFGLPSQKVRLIQNPLDIKEIDRLKERDVSEKFNGERFNIVARGRLCEQKGFSCLIRALEKVNKEYSKAHVYILGKGPLESKLKQLAKELHLEKKVHFLGFKNNPYKYIAHADLFVMSSLWEGLPGVLLEALACEVPIVSTDCKTGPREILQDGKYGELVSIKDSEALAEKIIYLLEHPETRKEYSQKGRERVGGFDAQKISKEYESFFREIFDDQKDN